jgi:hypothetical protein
VDAVEDEKSSRAATLWVTEMDARARFDCTRSLKGTERCPMTF